MGAMLAAAHSHDMETAVFVKKYVSHAAHARHRVPRMDVTVFAFRRDGLVSRVTSEFTSVTAGCIKPFFTPEHVGAIIIAFEDDPGESQHAVQTLLADLAEHPQLRVYDVVTVWGETFQGLNVGLGIIEPAPVVIIEAVEPLPPVADQAQALRVVLDAQQGMPDARTMSVAATALAVNNDIRSWLLPRAWFDPSMVESTIGLPPDIGPTQVARLLVFAMGLPDYLAPDALALAALWHMVLFGRAPESFQAFERALRINPQHDLALFTMQLWHSTMPIPSN